MSSSASSYLILCMTYHNVLGFDVSVYDAMTMKKFNCSRLSNKKNNSTLFIAHLTKVIESAVQLVHNNQVWHFP